MPDATASVATPRPDPEWSHRLSLLLSVVAGMVDLTGFLTLGNVFTAHVTGNLVLLAADLAHDAIPRTAQLLAVPAFMLACGLASIVARRSRAQDGSPITTLLRVQLGLIAGLFLFSMLTRPSEHPNGLAVSIATVLAVTAMGTQFILVRSALPGIPSTTTMTVNISDTVLLLVAASGPKPSPVDVRARLEQSSRTVAAFFGGCLVAGLAVKWLADLAWCLPLVAAAVTLMIHERHEPRA